MPSELYPPADGPFLDACAGRPTRLTPVWLMRQAGRILPAYRQLREAHASVADLFNTPELAARITLMPVAELGVDAAILFTDLVTPLQALGCPFEYAPGPVFVRPVRCGQDVNALRPLQPEEDLSFVLEAVRLARQGLPPQVPLIGYCGAPFTLAAWLVEGRGSRDWAEVRRLLHADAGLAGELLDRLTDAAIGFLCAQIGAGAQAVQLFDTSVGLLSGAQFARFVLPGLERICAALAPSGVPRIYFPLDGAHLLPQLGALDLDVLSVDWRVDLADVYAWGRPGRVAQGNLDPCALFAPGAELVRQVTAVLDAANGRPHVFNLGHGVLPETPLDKVRLLVDTVHEVSARRLSGG
ncbi:MAG: uroporphyrinogen decarboxylase [Candidatus Latescibacterota bacterium]